MLPAELNNLLRAPTESLGVELKNWLDLANTDNRARVAKELIALRNADGGVLVFGFDDKTLQPSGGRPEDIGAAFHADLIQGIVKDFCLPPFEVNLVVGERDGAPFPSVVVSSGVKSPSITRRSYEVGGKIILRQNALYVRSVFNGVVESTEPRSRDDWDRLIQICFDNREADIGRFFRRHLGRITEEIISLKNIESQRPMLATRHLEVNEPQAPYGLAASVRLLDQGKERYEAAVLAERSRVAGDPPSDRKGWREVAVVLRGAVRTVSAPQLLDELFSHHPRLTGCPSWIDPRGYTKTQNHPYVLDKGWQALVQSQRLESERAIDFWRLEPNGHFYLRQTLEDDLRKKLGDQRGKVLDFVLVVLRTAEALATAHEFARLMSQDPDKNSIDVAFRWRGLEDRELVSWVEPGRDFWTASKSRQSEVTTQLAVPLETSRAALGAYVAEAVKPVFEIFGFAASTQLIEEISAKLLQRGS